MPTRKIEGLALLQAQTPFAEYFPTVLDLRGPWTKEMVEAHEDYPDRAGLWVWEGSCEADDRLEHEADGNTIRLVSYTFTGEWRRLTEREALMIWRGLRPLTGEAMPFVDQLVKVA